MRTKTLLLTAALSIVGASTTMAQVYSVNAVGYVNTTLKAKCYSLVSNAMKATDNTVAKVFAGIPDGSVVYKYGTTGFEINNQDGGWDNPAMTVEPGEGVFILLGGSADWTFTSVGEVVQGTGANAPKINVPKGFSIRSSMVPQAGKLVTDLKFPAADGDTIYTYSCAGGYKINAFDGSAWDLGEPEVAVGEAFWVLKAAAADWVREFSVNP